MGFSEYRYLVLSDLYRATGRVAYTELARRLLVGESYRYVFWMRTAKYVRSHTLLKYTVYPFVKLILRRLKFQLGISIPVSTDIGSGFYIGHFGGIIVHNQAVIGKNCNISQGVTIGQVNRGKSKGWPVIGDNVYIGPGVKIVGAVVIGDNVAIGANSVVTKSIPQNSVAVGMPATIISEDGSVGYVNRTDYGELLEPVHAREKSTEDNTTPP